jgi:hypothetical protein
MRVLYATVAAAFAVMAGVWPDQIVAWVILLLAMGLYMWNPDAWRSTPKGWLALRLVTTAWSAAVMAMYVMGFFRPAVKMVDPWMGHVKIVSAVDFLTKDPVIAIVLGPVHLMFGLVWLFLCCASLGRRLPGTRGLVILAWLNAGWFVIAFIGLSALAVVSQFDMIPLAGMKLWAGAIVGAAIGISFFWQRRRVPVTEPRGFEVILDR